MTKHTIGILHPGAMGISVAATVQKSGHAVYWASERRSPETRERAKQFALQDAKTLEHLCATCNVIVSVCPPHAAETVANEVITCSFKGLYIDANAIAPQRTVRIGEAIEAAGATFVDGGIIGGPAWEPNTTWLYLSGEHAPMAATCFADGPLETQVIGEEIGKASAIKMCYAAYTKGTTALLSAILAAAEQLDVRETLYEQWSRDFADLPEQANRRTQRVTAKAWRFAGEMEEIAAAFRAVGVPGEFHVGAAAIYRRMSHFKGSSEMPALDDVLAALVREE
ncbi:MAG: DUF1932 domain-containing protein [Chloroflexota bacterium]